MTPEFTSDETRIRNHIEGICDELTKEAIEADRNIKSAEVIAKAHDWAYSVDFYDILMLLDIVAAERDNPFEPHGNGLDHWEQNDDERLQWMSYIRDLGDTTMRHAVMDHLAMCEMAPFERQDDYVFDEGER